MKILLVDDDGAIRNMYTDKLVADGFEVVTATNGEEALKEIEKAEFDVILLDVIMPKVNGFDALKQMRANLKTAKTPIYLLTNLPEDFNGQKAKEMGMSGYLFKAETEPGKLSEMMAKLRKPGDKPVVAKDSGKPAA